MGEKANRDLTEAISRTMAKDDIGILINLVSQLRDVAGEDGRHVTCQVPLADVHCKHWTGYGVDELCDAIEAKYANADGTKIPSANMTEF